MAVNMGKWPSKSPSPTPTLTLTPAGITPSGLQISPGQQVLIVNQSGVNRMIQSNPHPVHTECPPLNAAGVLQPGESGLTGTFDTDQLKRAESSVDQAAKMVAQLMVFSRSEGVIESKSIQIQEILFDAMEIGRTTFDRKITLLDGIPRDLPLISGDSTQLEQVFLNLLIRSSRLDEGL